MSEQDRSAPSGGADAAQRHRWERRILVATAVATIAHVMVERGARAPSDGVPLWARDTGVMVVLVAVGVLMPARLWASVRVTVLAVLGAVLVGEGGSHLSRIVARDVDISDLSGVPVALGGAAALMVACAIAFRSAGEPRTRWRWIARVVALMFLLVLGTYVVVPVMIGTVQVHMPRRPVAPPPSADFRDVTLRTADGLVLRAWYHPSVNGAAVMVLNSSRGDHVGSSAHARLLADHGYGVLVYDARGTGGSEGSPNGWGWTWLPDVRAGIDYLHDRSDVGGGRVGVLGLSTGADVAIEAAARDRRIRVVVADGATAQGFADRPPGWSTALSLRPMYAAGELLTGRSALPPLGEAMAAVAPRPVLLIAGGSIPAEIPLNERYAASGGTTAVLWALPEVHHTAAVSAVANGYERRVLGWLDEALQR